MLCALGGPFFFFFPPHASLTIAFNFVLHAFSGYMGHWNGDQLHQEGVRVRIWVRRSSRQERRQLGIHFQEHWYIDSDINGDFHERNIGFSARYPARAVGGIDTGGKEDIWGSFGGPPWKAPHSC